jgi:hypothetical protein
MASDSFGIAKLVMVLQLIAVAMVASSTFTPERPSGLRTAIQLLDRKWLRQIRLDYRTLEAASAGGKKLETWVGRC